MRDLLDVRLLKAKGSYEYQRPPNRRFRAAQGSGPQAQT